MKTKSSYHRSKNTYRFQSFSERIASVSIDVARSTEKRSEIPEDSDTFFSEALEKWSDLNCTQNFTIFRREICRQVQSFGQLLHNVDVVVDVLKKHLLVPGSLALQPLFDLVVQLSRDLQHDFYPKFPEFFEILIHILNSNKQDVDVLEWTFTCLSYLFKFQWRYMVKDIGPVYRLYCPLLSSKHKEYVQHFAAESFAFLMRKYKDHSLLFDIMFSSLHENPDQINGVGKLLFEMIRGVRHQFQSCFDKVFPIMLSKTGSTGSEGLSWDSVTSSLLHMMESITTFTDKDNSNTIIEALCDYILELPNTLKSVSKSNITDLHDQLFRLIQLVTVWIDYRDGVLITKPAVLCNVIVSVLKIPALSCEYSNTVLHVTSSFILDQNCTLQADWTTKLISAVFNGSFSREQVFEFSRQMFPMKLFEKDMLLSLITYCNKCMEHKDEESKLDVLFVIRDLLLYKCPTATDASDIDVYQTYSLDFGSTKRRRSRTTTTCSFPHYVVSILSAAAENADLDQDVDLQTKLWSATLCLLHIRLAEDERTSLQNSIRDILHNLGKASDAISERLQFILLQTVMSAFFIATDSDVFFDIVSSDLVVQLLKKYPNSVHILLAADTYFTAASNCENHGLLNMEVFQGIWPGLQDNLSSCYSQIRMLSLRILCQFNLPMPDVEEGIDQIGVFRICLEAEKVPLTVQTYRQKLVHLNKLDYSNVRRNVPVGPYAQTPLYYLLGTLYMNFTHLWEPVRQLVKSYADGLDRTLFWDVFGKHLSQTANYTEKELTLEEKNIKQTQIYMRPNISCDDNPVKDQFTDEMNRVANMTDRPDYVNYRHHLWQAMSYFSDKCEPKSRQIVPIFFRFLENEYYPTDLNVAPTEDLSKNDQDTVDIQNTFQDSEDLADKDDDVGQAEDTSKSKTRKRATTKSLVVHLKVFSQFKGPRSIYQEPKLTQLYFDLLQHKVHDVQRVALDCLLTYKYEYLMPYKENFDRLLDDKTFKNEIVLFSVDPDTGVVDEKHRGGLLPILMRLLYGKMQRKTGKDTSGRKYAEFRKSIIFRFLAACQQHELKVFLDLIFEPFKQFDRDDIVSAVTDSVKFLDLRKIIPLRKQQGSMNTMEVIFKKLGNLIDLYLPSMLRITLCVAATCSRLLDIRDQINHKAINTLKTLRQLALSRIIQFFTSFEKYPFTSEEIDAVFESVVWPQLERLSVEGVYNPTLLLKLLHTWSKNPRYFMFFAKRHKNNFEVTPLSELFKLLVSKHVHDNVVAMVLDIVENLLILEEQEVEGITMLQVNHCSKITAGDDELYYGCRLLLPHISVILEHLKTVVSKLAKDKIKKQSIPTKELNILSRISAFVMDAESSESIIKLLLPFLARNLTKSVDVEVDILHTVANLIKQVSNPVEFLWPLSRQFSSVTHRLSRTALCQVLEAIAETEDKIKPLADVITRLNSWDKRRVEEPDYNIRLEAFHEVNRCIEQMEPLDILYITMLIHNCCYLINHIEDMSLRDSASFSLQTIIKKLSTTAQPDSPDFNVLIVENIIPEIKKGLKAKTEVTRHEFISLLAILVRTYPTYTPCAALAVLTDPDPEGDFFENMRHIQTHRRARAMRKLGKVLDTQSMRYDIIIPYMLPTVSAYLWDETYIKQQHLIDAAIDTLGAICRQLPWERYLMLLRNYLGHLAKNLGSQKVYVRIVVVILDAFHFDISQSQGIDNNEQPRNREEVKVVDTIEEDGNKDTEDAVEMETNEASHLKEDDATTSYVNKQDITMKVCSSGLATRIHRLIVRNILPQLHKTLIRKTKSDDEHRKAAPTKYAEDEEVLRVPIALAMVKLLNYLPKGALQQNLSGILIKVCQFLRSRSKDIRVISRGTLIKIADTLGPRYFFYILKELKSSLQRGYQLHVLCYTVHALLKSLTPCLTTGDMDSYLHILIEICNEELFGNVAEEKDVEGIVGKLMEAKSSKSYDSYEIMAKFVSKNCLGKLVEAIKQKLEATKSHKVAKKCQEVLKRICYGLTENKGVTEEELLIFIYSLTSETLPALQPKEKQQVEEEVLDPRIKPPSTYLLKPTPPRGGIKTPVLKKTNMHILVEFGLQVLHMLLKRSRVVATNLQHLQMLDPFVKILAKCLSSKHVKIMITTLRCVSWLLKFPLPSNEKHVRKISNSLFLLLKNYASAGAAKGDNFDLVVMCFKAVTVLVRDVKYYMIDNSQLKVLLSYCEEDIHDFSRQATAFTLLKAILSRKLKTPEMPEIINRISQLSVTADSPHVRLQCRQVVLQYLLDYPIGKNLKKHLDFFVSQLEYEHENGRESALEMVATMFSSFPKDTLLEYAGYFFVPMSARLINDESARCRRLTALAIKSLLGKIDGNKRDELFSITLGWFQDKMIAHKRLASQLCGLFVEVESGKFERHLVDILPVMCQLVNPALYENSDERDESDTKDLDYLLFHILTTLCKLMRECNLTRNTSYTEEMNVIWECVHVHILHPHCWVRLITSQLFGLLFSSWEPSQLLDTLQLKSAKKKNIKPEYMTQDLVVKLKSLTTNFCRQLQSTYLSEELGEQIVKNLIYLARVIKGLDDITDHGTSVVLKDIHTKNDMVEQGGTENIKRTFNLKWLIRKLCREAAFEASQNQKVSLKRSCVIKFLAAVAIDLGSSNLTAHLDSMIPPLHRAINDTSASADESLKSLAQEALDLMKSLVGIEAFTKGYSSVHKSMTDKRERKKKTKALEAVSNPEVTARKKIKKNIAKKEAKKRRIIVLRPSKSAKKKKYQDFVMD